MTKKIFYWLPRLLSLAFIGFIAQFAPAVFKEYQSLGGYTTALHFLPSLILLVSAIVSWQRDLLGALTFLVAAFYYVWTVGIMHGWAWHMFVFIWAFLISILFLLNWMREKNANKKIKK